MIRKYPAVFLLCFIVIGIAVADRTHVPAWAFLLLVLLVGVTGLFALARLRLMTAAVLFPVCLGAFSGFQFAVRYYDTGPRHLSNLLSEPMVYRVFGRVSDWPDLKPNRTEIKISLDSLGGSATLPVRGQLLLKVTDTTTALQRGDYVEFTGRIYPLVDRKNDIGFDYQRYLSLRGVAGIVYLPTLLNVRVDHRSTFGFFHVIDRLRDAILGSFRRNLEPTQAALASGFLIGETRGIPSSVYNMFRDSGTLHLLAVSGSNVALVLLVAIFLLRPFALSRWKRALALLVVILTFTALSYGEPSVIRASVMAALVITAGLAQRRYDLNNIIALTAVIILLFDPGQFFDIGFQLSFVTAWGLIFVVPKVARMFETYHNRRWYRWLVFPGIVAFVAQLVSTPLVAFHFNRVPVISIFANLLIVPVVSIAVVALLAMLLADLIWPVLGLFVGSIVNVLLGLVLRLLHVFGGENMVIFKPAGVVPEQWLSWLMVGSYAVLIVLTVAVVRRNFRKITLAVGLVVVNVALIGGVARSAGSQQPVLEVISVPGGAVALVYQPGADRGDLVFAGLQARDYRIDERIIHPWLESRGISQLNSVFVTSCAYGAIDDILRLAVRFRPRGIYVHSSLKSSFTDARATIADSIGESAPIIAYSSPLPDLSSEGLSPCDSGVLIKLGECSALVTDRLGEELLLWRAPCRRHILVIGERWQPSAVDWITLQSRGTTCIICSKIAPHIHAKSPTGDMSPDAVLPDYLYDLTELGSIRVALTD